MPLIMDEDVDMDMDDLFGDGNALSLPVRPPPKEVLRRIDELRSSGCSQAISWSKWGSIASISSTGFGIELRNLRCSPRDGSWELAGPTTLNQITPTLDGGPLKLVLWSPNGCDLAVIDAIGRISILTISVSLNRPNVFRSGHSDPLDDIHSVAGAYWLNSMPPRQQAPYLHRRATKTDEGWRYDMSQGISFGPCHPLPAKSALMCITTNGLLRLIYPQADIRWSEASLEIEGILSSDELITHAAICGEHNNSLTIALATNMRQLRIIRVVIKWGTKSVDKPGTANQMQIAPHMMFKHIAVTSWLETRDSSNLLSSTNILSGLYVLPPAPDAPSGNADRTTVLAMRHHVPSTASQYNQDVSTIFDRWELQGSTQTMHGAFEELSSRRNSSVAQPAKAMTFQRLETIAVPKLAVALDTIVFDRILVISYSDGSVEYRNRWTMAELYTEGGLDQFSHLSQAGFMIMDDEPCLYSAISPTSCSLAKIGLGGKVRWKGLAFQMGQVTLDTDESQYSAVVAGLAMTLSSAILSTTSQDDLLAVAKMNVDRKNFLDDWLMETCRILKFSVDFSEESQHDNLVRNPSIQFCLSIRSSWGFHGNSKARDFSAQLAWVGLQTRNCVVLFTMATSMKVPLDAAQTRKISGIEDSESIRMLTGSIKWCLDLMAYIIDGLLNPQPHDLFEQITSSTPDSTALSSLSTQLQSSQNISLHLLLCSGTRGYLTAICRRLTHLDYTARKAMATAASQAASPQGQQQQGTEHISNSLRNAYTTIATLTNNAVIQIRFFEQFLTNITTSIKESYTNAGLSSTPAPGQPPNMTNDGHEQRNKIEQNLLFGGPLPTELAPTIHQIFSTHLPEIWNNIDPARLFFHDFSILNLKPPSSTTPPAHIISTKPTPSTSLHDSFLRLPLGTYPHTIEDSTAGNIPSAAAASGSKEKRFRRCVRCAAVMEDLNSRRAAVSFMIMQQRRCFCGGFWVVLKGSEVGL